MKQKLYRNVLILVICVFSIELQAQQRKIKADTDEFDQYALVDTRKLYKHLADRGFKTQEVFEKLGDSYYFTGEYEDAVQWYEKLLRDSKKFKNINPKYYFRYAQALESVGKYGLSKREMGKFRNLTKSDYGGELFTKEQAYLKEIKKRSGKITVKKKSFNSGL